MASITYLTSSAGLIFSGTVMKIGESLVPELRGHENLLVVRVDRGLRVDPVLGELRGKMITVETPTPSDFRLQQQAIFFTNSWIHGQEIAVREVAHLDIKVEKEVVAAVQGLPDLHLKERLASAYLVVLAEVVGIQKVSGQVPKRNAPLWAIAILQVESALKGAAVRADLYFPTSRSRRWTKAPRFEANQRGVFLLHQHEQRAANWLANIGQPDALTTLDPADFQPASKLADIKTFFASK